MDEIERFRQGAARRDGTKRKPLRDGAVGFAVLLCGGYAVLRLMDGILRIAGVG